MTNKVNDAGDDVEKSVDSGAKMTDDGDNKSEPKTFTQEQIDQLISNRVKNMKAKHEQEIKDLQSKLETSEPGKTPPKKDQKDSFTIEDVKNLVNEAVSGTLNNFNKEIAKRDLLAEHGKDLLPAYKVGISGDTEEEIFAAIADAKSRQKEDLEKTGLGAKQNFGSGNTPPNKDNGKTFKLSEIRDPVFAKKNATAILKAMREGNVIKD